MDAKDWKNIKKNTVYIHDNLKTEKLMYHLYEEDVLTEDDVERVKSYPTSSEKCWAILQVLKKTPGGREMFISCLKKTNQDHIVEKLQASADLSCLVQESQRECCNLTLKILKKSPELRRYQFINAKGETKRHIYFDLIGGNSTKTFNIRVYIAKYFEDVFEDLTYDFVALRKMGTEFWVTKECTINCAAPIYVPKKVAEQAPILPEEGLEYGIPRSLKDALSWHGSLSLITGTVIAVSPIQYQHDGQLAVISLYIKDHSGCANVSLFGKNATSEIRQNDIVVISKAFHKIYRGTSYLSTMKESECEIIHGGELQHLEVNGSYFRDDDHFVYDGNKRENITVKNIKNVHIYQCCMKRGCRKKKVIDNFCPKCGDSNAGLSCVAKLIFCNIERVFSVFEDDLRTIINENLDLSSKQTLLRQLSQKLPFTFSCVLQGETIRNIQVKRPLE